MAGVFTLFSYPLIQLIRLNGAVGFSGMILWWVRIFNEFEVSGARDLPLP